jgi:hypothetical protein
VATRLAHGLAILRPSATMAWPNTMACVGSCLRGATWGQISRAKSE